ncbi:MAG TPA: T9SS type A sorting domain-containing protein [Bacteroidales bacterium]|nr:T9SS type A sorting domain-containing protein [Bacteroidales bacterium]
MKSCSLCIPLLWIAASIYGQNLVQNPGMEDWEKVIRPSGWSHVEKCTKDSSVVHSGNYSCLHSGGTSTSDLGQNITVVPGKDYTLSLFYMTAPLTEGKGSRIWCYWKDSNGVNLSDPATDELMRPSAYLKSLVWEKFTINVKAPENAVVFYLEVRTNTNCGIYWDDFSFSETTTVNMYQFEFSEPYIYPVPADDQIFVHMPSSAETIEILDIGGSMIFKIEVNGTNQVTIPLERLKPGIYFAVIRSGLKYRVLRFIRK